MGMACSLDPSIGESMPRRTHLLLRLLLCFGAPMLHLPLVAADLARDEQVMFLPSTARMLDDGALEVRIESWVFEYERRPGVSALLARHLDLDLDQLAAVDRERFYERTQLFRVDSESNIALQIRFLGWCGTPTDCGPWPLPRSNLAGRSSSVIRLPPSTVTPRTWLRFELIMPAGDRRHIEGRALLVPGRGLSVISDVDDTIKNSQVQDRHQLLLNTFAREFQPVPGMSERYRELNERADVRFHYVSSAPIQLHSVLARFLRDQQFPDGSVHLRESTSITNVIAAEGDSRTHKLSAIRQLIADFPQRHFLLIGDSGEADPEIYAEIARQHPAQIVGIRIRDVSGETATSSRYRETFRDLPSDFWQIFREPAQLRTVQVPARQTR